MSALRARRAVAVAAMTAAVTMSAALPAAQSAQAATAPTAVTAAASSKAVDFDTWLKDVQTVAGQAHTYLDQRTGGASGGKLAIVLDIDNTSLESYFSSNYPVPAVPPVLDLATFAHSRGVAVFFVTARPSIIHDFTQYNLTKVGYPVDGLYDRGLTDLFTDVASYKTGKRIAIEKLGYTIIANIGNSTTDLTGGHAEQTFKLPDYNGQLD